MNQVYKTDYPEHYKYYCKGYKGQILASNNRRALELAILEDWFISAKSYEIAENIQFSEKDISFSEKIHAKLSYK